MNGHCARGIRYVPIISSSRWSRLCWWVGSRCIHGTEGSDFGHGWMLGSLAMGWGEFEKWLAVLYRITFGLLTIPFFEGNSTELWLSVSGCRKCLCGGGGRVLTEVRDLSNCPFEQWPKPSLGIIPLSHIGIIIRQYKDIYEPTSLMECQGFLNFVQLLEDVPLRLGVAEAPNPPRNVITAGGCFRDVMKVRVCWSYRHW